MHGVSTAQDLSQPHQWFPFARSIHRKVIYHAGKYCCKAVASAAQEDRFVDARSFILHPSALPS